MTSPNQSEKKGNGPVQFEKTSGMKAFKDSLNSFWRKMTTPGTSYAEKLKTMNPQEVVVAREKLRTKIKYGSYSFVILVMTGYALYSKCLFDECCVTFHVVEKKELVIMVIIISV